MSTEPSIAAEIQHHKCRRNALLKHRAQDDPKVIAATLSLRAAKLAAYVEKAVSEAPPLTPEQIDRIALLLSPVGGGAA
jgi:hypothetical protein